MVLELTTVLDAAICLTPDHVDDEERGRVQLLEHKLVLLGSLEVLWNQPERGEDDNDGAEGQRKVQHEGNTRRFSPLSLALKDGDCCTCPGETSSRTTETKHCSAGNCCFLLCGWSGGKLAQKRGKFKLTAGRRKPNKTGN